MTNIEHYNLDNIVFKTLDYKGNIKVLEVYYKPKHSKELIKLVSMISTNVAEDQAKWALREYKPLEPGFFGYLPFEYQPRHAIKHVISEVA